MTKLLEKHYVEIRRTTSKYKQTRTVFVEELLKQLFKPTGTQELKNMKKYL